MRKWLLAAALLVLLLVTCVSDREEEGAELTYTGPTELGIGVGEFLPGTDIQYLGKTEEGAQVLIGGQPALKKMGDSLNWQSDLLDGVTLDLNMRTALITEEKLHALGTARIAIQDPVSRPGPVNESAPVRYKLPVDYHIKKGQAIPGTPILYLGETAQGAHLGNIEGYAYRAVGDSIVWKGQLRDRVWLELNLRTILIGDKTLNVGGTAELWIAP